VIEDFRTARYHAVRLLATCGDVYIEKAGHVVATVRAVNATVAGKLTGDVTVARRLIIQKTGQVRGDIQAAQLRIESGAVIDGFVRIADVASTPPSDVVP
jgi:cytoskeletal protein CcmA (bactofilin family)